MVHFEFYIDDSSFADLQFLKSRLGKEYDDMSDNELAAVLLTGIIHDFRYGKQ